MKVHKVVCTYNHRLAARHSAPYILECSMRGCEWSERATTRSVAKDRRDWHLRLNKIHEQGNHTCGQRVVHVNLHARTLTRQVVCQVCGPIAEVGSRKEARVLGNRHYREAVRLAQVA